MAKGTSGRPTREASILAAYKLLSEDSSFLLNIYRCHHILIVRSHRSVSAATESPYHRKVLRAHQFCRRLKLSYYQWEVSSVCYMLQVPLIISVSFLGFPYAEYSQSRIAVCFSQLNIGSAMPGTHMPMGCKTVIPVSEISHLQLIAQWWEKLLVNLTVLGVILLFAYGAFNQIAKIPIILNSFMA